MTLRERIERAHKRSGITICATCGTRHDGAAWAIGIGWHDKSEQVVSPFVQRARAGQLPPKVTS